MESAAVAGHGEGHEYLEGDTVDIIYTTAMDLK